MSENNYQDRKRFFDSLLTIYGRKPVLEALRAPELTVYRLHLADSNRMEGTLKEILQAAQQRNVEILYHSRKELARISRNGKQDQGVAADLQCGNYRHYREFLQQPGRQQFRVIALDGITNPQNLGMIIRSVCASGCDGLLLPQKGCASLSPLVIKASVGTLFQCPILRCDRLSDALDEFRSAGAQVCTLSSHSRETLQDFQPEGAVVYVLGNETEGVSPAVMERSDTQLCIPMHNSVESLNVAVTAALVAFKP
ncbi:MAG: RNA methyltransferase [Porticoccaceae bacterium]|nr:RNA methyltransferase [Porticoccaceae bacterium]